MNIEKELRSDMREVAKEELAGLGDSLCGV